MEWIKLLNVKTPIVVFCFRKTDVEYIDFNNDDGCTVFAIHVCKDCAKDLKKGIADLFKEGE